MSTYQTKIHKEPGGDTLVVEQGGQINIAADAAEAKIYVDPNGDDTNGTGTILSPVASLTKAFTLVTATRLIVIMSAGNYAEAAAVVWPTRKGVVVRGAGSNFTSISATGTSVITVTPGVQSSTWTAHLEGVTIDHSAGAAQSGITFNNTGMTKKLLFNAKNCAYSADAVTDKSINVATHTDADNAIRVYLSGDGSQVEMEGAILFTVDNLADRLHCEQMWMKGTITTPNVAKEFRLRLYKCIVAHGAAVAGGNATQIVTAVDCHSWIDYNDNTAEIFAALDTNELTGSHSEVIVA